MMYFFSMMQLSKNKLTLFKNFWYFARTKNLIQKIFKYSKWRIMHLFSMIQLSNNLLTCSWTFDILKFLAIVGIQFSNGILNSRSLWVRLVTDVLAVHNMWRWPLPPLSLWWKSWVKITHSIQIGTLSSKVSCLLKRLMASHVIIKSVGIRFS